MGENFLIGSIRNVCFDWQSQTNQHLERLLVRKVVHTTHSPKTQDMMIVNASNREELESLHIPIKHLLTIAFPCILDEITHFLS